MFIFTFEWILILPFKKVFDIIKYYGKGQPQVENIILIKVLRATAIDLLR